MGPASEFFLHLKLLQVKHLQLEGNLQSETLIWWSHLEASIYLPLSMARCCLPSFTKETNVWTPPVFVLICPTVVLDSGRTERPFQGPPLSGEAWVSQFDLGLWNLTIHIFLSWFPETHTMWLNLVQVFVSFRIKVYLFIFLYTCIFKKTQPVSAPSVCQAGLCKDLKAWWITVFSQERLGKSTSYL